MKEKGAVTKAFGRALHQLVFGYAIWLLGLGLIVYLLSGIYKVEGDAVGVLTRFSRIVDSRVTPGLHYKMPWPIDRVQIVQIKQIKTMAITDFHTNYMQGDGGRAYSFFKETELEPYCITGDDNIVAISLVLKYTIGDPVKYLYGLKQPEIFMERCAAHLIVHKLASLEINKILTIGKKQLEFELQNELSEELERAETGISLSFLEIREIKPPTTVQQYFDRVINAEVEKTRALHQAQGYYNRIVPEARSQANELIQEARAYKREKVNSAEGEASRFLSRFKGYRENPEAHREKIYLEFIQKMYPGLGEIRVVKTKANNQQVVVPIFPR